MDPILVKECMDHSAHTVSTSSTVLSAVETMIKNKISGVPVVDAENRLVGYVSEQDCIKELLNDAFFCEDSAPVTKVMQPHVVAVDSNTTIVEIAQRFINERFRIYPVTENGKLVGVINRAHILKALIASTQSCYHPG